MKILRLVMISLVLMNYPSFSKEPNVSLIEGCNELVNIYKSKNKKHLLAAQTTSLTESLRAGFCLGVIKEYSKNHRCRSDWFDRAKFIAKFYEERDRISETSILKQSCEI